MSTNRSILIALVLLNIVSCQIIIESSDKAVKLITHIAESKTQLVIKNSGNRQENSFIWKVCNYAVEKLIFIKAEGLYQTYNDLNIKSIGKEGNYTNFEITFKYPLNGNQMLTLKITEDFFGKMQPLPKKITISEDQNVIYFDNVVLYSSYEVVKQKVSYTLPSPPLSATEIPDSTKKAASSITYGPFINSKPYTETKIKLHFENNKPFVVFKEVKQSVEVSHWGNIKIKTEFKLSNEGAVLTGEYNRVDYNPNKPNSGKNALKSLSAELPFHATGVYYRDEVGNISTSNAYRRKSEIDFPYSVVGSQTGIILYLQREIGYDLPMHHYLFTEKSNSENFVLKQNFGFSFEDLHAEEYEIQVILPEGSENIQVEIFLIQPNLPFEVDSIEYIKTHSYLDPIGRPTLVIKKKNVMKHHNQEFTVNYSFQHYNILIEPFLLFGVYLIFFMSLVVIGRFQYKMDDKCKTN